MIKKLTILCLTVALGSFGACQLPSDQNPLTGATNKANGIKAGTDTGKLTINFNFGDQISEESFQSINANDFIEIKGFHTQSTIADIDKVRISIEGDLLDAPVTRDVTRSQINSSAIVIKDLPVGAVDVSVTLLDKNGGNLDSDQKLVKVVANIIVPVEFDLKLINEINPQTDSPADVTTTGGIAVSINVKEETRVYGRVEVSKPVVSVGEPVAVRVTDVQGDVKNYNFDVGDGSTTKVQATPVLQSQTFNQPGEYNVQAKLQDDKGGSFVTKPVTVRVENPNNKPATPQSNSYQPKVTVKSSINASAPVALQGQGIFDQNGEGFPPNITVQLHFQKPDGSLYDPLNQATDSKGTFKHQWAPSSTAPFGIYYFWATYNYGGQTINTVKVSYRVDEVKVAAVPKSTSLKALNVSLLGQRDTAWASQQLGSCGKSTTIGSDGCTITSLTMVLNYNNIQTTPDKLNKFLTQNSGYASGCLLYWSAIKKASNNLLTDREISQSEVSKYIAGGTPVIAKLVGYLPYEHWVVITGIQDDGRYLINDPWYPKQTAIQINLAKKFHVQVK